MRALDVCSGAGGLSLGLLAAGYTVHAVELDRDAVDTHRANVGPCDHASLTDWTPAERFDVVCGGVPCQPFSVAGKRCGTRDPRGELYTHLLRVASQSGARAVVLENVPGLLTWRDPSSGKDMGAILREAFAAAGYTAIIGVLDAADYGVPQHRRRTFVVGFRDCEALAAFQWPAATHGKGPGLLPFATVRDALGLRGEYAAGRLPGATGWQGQRAVCVAAPGYTVGTRRNADWIAPAALDAPAPVVTTTENYSGAVGARGGKARPRRACERMAVPGQAVRLTVEQLSRLQGFPAGFVFAGNVTSQNRQVGNAVPPALGAAVLRAVRDALNH